MTKTLTKKKIVFNQIFVHGRYEVQSPCCEKIEKFVEVVNSDYSAPYFDFEQRKIFYGIEDFGDDVFPRFCMFCGAEWDIEYNPQS